MIYFLQYATKHATEDIQDRGVNLCGGDQLTQVKGNNPAGEEQLTQILPNTVLKIENVQGPQETASFDKNENSSEKAPMRHFSLHFPKSSVILNVDIKSDAKEVSFHIPNTSSIINVKLDNIPVDETNPSQNIESVDDRFWYVVKLDKRKLLQYYLMLSKIRLTGKC